MKLELLHCPRCYSTLHRSASELQCQNGHSYHLIDQTIPVLLLPEVITSQLQHQLAYFGVEFAKQTPYRLEPWMKKYVHIALSFFGTPREEQFVLDVGAGSGYMSIELARRGWHVIALDLTPQSLQKLLHHAHQEGVHTRITPVVASALALPLKNNAISAVVANAVIEHLPDDNKFLAEIARVTQPSARGILVAPIRFKYVWPWWWPVNYIHDRRIGHLRRYDRNCCEELLARHGFKIDDVLYTGHALKVCGTLLQMLLKTNRFDNLLERLDARAARHAYGSSNITVLFSRP